MSANETTQVAAVPTFDCRQTFVETLIELAQADKRIVAVCNDSVGSSNLGAFAKQFPDRLVNVGIAEQNMVGVAAGLANGGFIPFVCAAGPFLSGRATEQIKADVAYSQHKVILCAMSPGMAYGELGPTHHSVEDLSWMRPLPGLDIAVPADRRQTRQAVEALVADPRPTYLRIGRTKAPDVTTEADAWERGRFTVARQGSDVTLIGLGTTVSRALGAAAELAADGVDARVLNAAWVSPLDREAIVAAASETRAIVVAEEANIAGGLAAAVAQVVAQLGVSTKVIPVGLTEFAPTGSTEWLLDHFGLTASNIARAAREAL